MKFDTENTQIERAKRILESAGYSVINLNEESHISLEDIQNAPYAASFMKDRAEINIDGQSHVKIGDDKWEHHSKQGNVLGATYRDKQLYDKIAATDNSKIKTFNLNKKVDN